MQDLTIENIIKSLEVGMSLGLMSKEEAVKLLTIIRHGYLICEICGEEITRTRNKNRMYSVDHRTPLSKKGSHRLNNLQSAHRCCNNKKGDN